MAAKPPYNNIEHAYNHLKRDDRYQPFEPRYEDDWVLVLFPETMSYRLFETLENVGKFYQWCIYRSNVYVRPEQLAAKHTSAKLLEMCKALNLDTENKTSIELSKMLWKYCQETGDKVVKAVVAAEEAEEKDVYTVRIDLLRDSKVWALVETLPLQAKIIAAALRDTGASMYNEDELSDFAKDLVKRGILKTKQDPFRVVRYYAPQFSDIGVMTYTARKKKTDD